MWLQFNILLILMSHSIETHYFQSTLPGYIDNLLAQSINQKEDKLLNFSDLETKLFYISYKGLSRLKYVQIILKEMVKYREKLSQIMKKDSNNENRLKNYCKNQLFIWKLNDELKKKQKLFKQSEQIINKQVQVQQNYLQDFYKCFERLRITTQLKKEGSFQAFLVQSMLEISDSDRIPRKFKERMRQVLLYCGMETIAKYMKILGDELGGKTTPEGYSTPINEFIKQKQQRTMEKPEYESQIAINSAYRIQPKQKCSSVPIPSKNKKIFKEAKMTPSRTLYIGHPIHHRIYRPKPNQTEQIKQNAKQN